MRRCGFAARAIDCWVGQSWDGWGGEGRGLDREPGGWWKSKLCGGGGRWVWEVGERGTGFAGTGEVEVQFLVILHNGEFLGEKTCRSCAFVDSHGRRFKQDCCAVMIVEL